MRPQHVRSRAF